MNCGGQLCSDTPNVNLLFKKRHLPVQLKCILLSPTSRKLYQELVCFQTSERGRGKSRSSLFLSLCCPELLPKTAQATQRLHIYWWLHNTEKLLHLHALPWDILSSLESCYGSQTLQWLADAQYLSGSSSYSRKNNSFIKHGDFVLQHKSIQSSMFPSLQVALTLHQVIHWKGH